MLLAPRADPRPLELPVLRGAQIAGLGAALPPRVVSNDEAGRAAGVDDAWIVRRTGISSRRHAEPGGPAQRSRRRGRGRCA